MSTIFSTKFFESHNSYSVLYQILTEYLSRLFTGGVAYLKGSLYEYYHFGYINVGLNYVKV